MEVREYSGKRVYQMKYAKGLNFCRRRRVRGNLRETYLSVHGYIRIAPSATLPQGGTYQIANCGSGCQVLISHDPSRLRGMKY